MDFNNFYPSTVYGLRGRFITDDELEALREAVEVLEGIPQPTRAELAYYKAEMKYWVDKYCEQSEHGEAAMEAVEVLEDMYAQRDAETEKWFQKWMEEFSNHYRTRAALHDAEAKIAELHKQRDDAEDRAYNYAGEADRKQAERDDYAARLKASNQDYIALQRRANEAAITIQRMRGFLGGSLATAIRRITLRGGSVRFDGDTFYGGDNIILEVSNGKTFKRFRNIIAGTQLDLAFEPDRVLGDAIDKAVQALDRA